MRTQPKFVKRNMSCLIVCNFIQTAEKYSLRNVGDVCNEDPDGKMSTLLGGTYYL